MSETKVNEFCIVQKGEYKNIKLSKLDNKQSTPWMIMSFDEARTGTSQYGDWYQYGMTLADDLTERVGLFCSGKERAKGFGKTLVGELNKLKKDDRFRIIRVHDPNEKAKAGYFVHYEVEREGGESVEEASDEEVAKEVFTYALTKQPPWIVSEFQKQLRDHDVRQETIDDYTDKYKRATGQE